MSDISKIQVGETLYDVKDQTARDNFSNAKITTINNLSDDNHLPTAKAVYDYFNNQLTTSITDYGSTIPTSGAVQNFFNNAKTSVISSSSDNDHIPTAKAVYDYIQNNGGSSSNFSGVFINPSEYYTVQTIHVDASNIKEENIINESTYKISDYTEHDGVFKITEWDSGKTTYHYALDAGVLYGIELSLDVNLWMLIHDNVEIMIAPEGIQAGEAMTLPSGMYANNTEFSYTIQLLKKKENYIIQKEYNFQFDENALMNGFHKVSDNIDYNGLFSVYLSLMTDNGVDLQYDCGGYFEPVEKNYPHFSGMPAYTLNSNYLIRGEENVPAVVIFIQEFTIPAGFANNEEDIQVTPGIYMAMGNSSFGVFKLVKLQEKEEILDIDNLFGAISDYGTFTQTLNTQIFTTGTSSLVFSENDFDENTTLNEDILYDMFKAAYEQNGVIKLRLHGEVGGENTDLIAPISAMWKSGTVFGASTQVYLYANETWILYKLQIYSSLNYFTVRCEGSAISD